MNSRDDSAYRWSLAQGFIKEAEQDFQLERWRSCVDNAQLSLENAAKALISCYEPPEKTHEPSPHIQRLIEEGKIPGHHREKARTLMELFTHLGFEEHIMSDTGDEKTGKSPWEIFDKDSARDALDVAREGVNTVDAMIRDLSK